MKNNNSTVYVPVALSFLFAFCWMIIPLPNAAKWLRPDLVTLLVIYWVVFLPDHFGIAAAFTVGLLFDLLTGMLLGSMGLALGVVAFCTLNLRLRIRVYGFWQKFIVILLLIACCQLIRLWVQILVGHPPANIMYWLCSITTALTWPLVSLMLGPVKRPRAV